MSKFLDSFKTRRTNYAISKETPISKDEIKDIINEVVINSPTAFNSQSDRVIVLFGEESDSFWEITREELRKIVPEEQLNDTDQRINGFKNGYGTILFFEEADIIKGLQENVPLYKDNFPIWSLEGAGMLQLAVWTALSEQGFGASLQHYNPLVDAEVAKRWNVPSSWKLLAQMPFGKKTAEAGQKEVQPIENRVKFIG